MRVKFKGRVNFEGGLYGREYGIPTIFGIMCINAINAAAKNTLNLKIIILFNFRQFQDPN